MNIKLTIKYIYFLALNAAYAAIGYMAYQGHPNWNNVFVLLTWIILISGLGMFNDELAVKYGKDMKLSDWFCHMIDGGLMCAAVWVGWWWTAIAILIGAAGNQNARDEYRKFVQKTKSCPTPSSETGPLSNTGNQSPSA